MAPNAQAPAEASAAVVVRSLSGDTDIRPAQHDLPAVGVCAPVVDRVGAVAAYPFGRRR